MKKVLTGLQFRLIHRLNPIFSVMLVLLGFNQQLNAQNTLASGSGSGISVATSSATYSTAASATVTVTRGTSKVMVIATFSVTSSSATASTPYFRLNDGTTSSTPVGRYLSGTAGTDKGIGSCVHIFSTSGAGAKTFNFQHAAGTEGIGITTTVSLVAVELGAESGSFDLSSSSASVSALLTTNTSAFTVVTGAVTGAVTNSINGEMYVTASFNVEKNGSGTSAGEWELQTSTDGTTYSAVGLPISRTWSNNSDVGAVSLATVITNVTGIRYYRLVQRRTSGTGNVGALNVTIAAVGLAHSAGKFPGFRAISSSAATTSTDGVAALSQAETSANDNTSLLLYAQMNMTASATLESATYWLTVPGATLSSTEMSRYLASSSSVGSGAIVGLASNLDTGTGYTASLMHKVSNGTVTLTTRNIVLGGFQLTDVNNDNRWTGTTSSDWTVTTNWSKGTLPDATTNVVISDVANDPVIGGAATCLNLTIESGGSLSVTGANTLAVSGDWTNYGSFTPNSSTVTFDGTAQFVGGLSTTTFNNLTISSTTGTTIKAGSSVTISGTLTTNDKLTINSTSVNNSGSLIVTGTSTGMVTYNRYMLGGTNWHLFSSPVSGQSINTFVTTPANSIATNSDKYGVGYYNEGTNTWTTYTTATAPGAGSFTLGIGYEGFRTADGPAAFTGTMVSSASQTLARTAVTNAGWNLVGNPFTAFVNGNTGADATNNFLTVNTASIDAGFLGIYYWTGSVYEIINHSSSAERIAPGQGFFIRAADNTGRTVSFSSAMRTHTAGTFKSSGMPSPEIELIAETGAKTSKTVVRFIPDMTVGLDPGYDAGAFEQNPSFGVSTRLVDDNGINFAIQCLPDQDYQQLTIPVGLNAQAGSEVTFSVKGTNLARWNDLYLEDRLTGRSIRVDDTPNSYSFTLDGSAAGTGRFYITNQLGSSGTRIDQNDPVKVIPVPNENMIRISGNINFPAQVMIYDLTGKVLSSVRLTGDGMNQVGFNQSTSGIYLMQIRSGQDIIREKINWVR